MNVKGNMNPAVILLQYIYCQFTCLVSEQEHKPNVFSYHLQLRQVYKSLVAALEKPLGQNSSGWWWGVRCRKVDAYLWVCVLLFATEEKWKYCVSKVSKTNNFKGI